LDGLGAECGSAGRGEEEGASSACHGAIVRARAAGLQDGGGQIWVSAQVAWMLQFARTY
jgi:hypothetical protein